MKAIEVNGLTKIYRGNITAVDHLSFEVRKGEVFGLLGLNGAGKSTTMLVLSTLRHPSAGSATVMGYDITREKDQVRRCIGVVFEEQAVDTFLTGRQNLDFYARMYNLPAQEREEKVREVLQTVGLASQADTKVKDYSGGMVRRLEIARGMLTNPQVLFLDEPTIGVDVQTRRYLWDYVKQLNREQGTTIFLATSYLDEADYLCDRVAIIHQGKLMAVGTPQELKAEVGENLISLKPAPAEKEELIKILQSEEWVSSITQRDGWIELVLKDKTMGVPDLMRFSRDRGFVLSGIESHQIDLNQVILHFAGGAGEESYQAHERIQLKPAVANSNRMQVSGIKTSTRDIVEVNQLTKKFGDLTAVDGISFSVKEGEIFGLLGPNGAGKSTTIKILTTLLHPTTGSAKINGYDVVKQRREVRASIGVVFQDRSSDTYLTGRQNLDFHGRMYSLSKEEREKRISEVLDLLELKGKENIRLNDMPEGMRRRFEVARGFMTYPKVVFLDEPTVGFDIKARMALWEQIKRARDKEKVTIILTTHYIEEADYLCDRVAIIDQAKIKAIDTPSGLKEAIGTELVSLEFTNSPNGKFSDLVETLDWVKKVEKHGNSFVLSVERGESRVFDLVDLTDRAGLQVASINFRKPSLEDAFIHFTGRTIREAESSEKSKGMKRRRN